MVNFGFEFGGEYFSITIHYLRDGNTVFDVFVNSHLQYCNMDWECLRDVCLDLWGEPFLKKLVEEMNQKEIKI